MESFFSLEISVLEWALFYQNSPQNQTLYLACSWQDHLQAMVFEPVLSDGIVRQNTFDKRPELS